MALIVNPFKKAIIQKSVDEITVEQKYLRKTVKIILINGNGRQSVVSRAPALV